MSRQLSSARVGTRWKKTIEWLQRVLPGLMLLTGLAAIVLILASTWLAPDFPYIATPLNKLIVQAEGEMTQVFLGVFFGILAGFTIKNARDLILSQPSNTGASADGKGGARTGRARHIWLAGSLMLLVFFGLFAPHLSNLIANMTRFKTALFEFEVKSGAASRRLQFIEKRSGSFGLTALAWAQAMPAIIGDDLGYLENVALKIIDSEIKARSAMPAGTPAADSLIISKLKHEKKEIESRINNLQHSETYINEYMSPILICGHAAVVQLVDVEIVRNALRVPANDLRLILTAPPPYGRFDQLSENFVTSLKSSRDELYRFVQDKKSCPEYHAGIKLNSRQIMYLKKSPYIYLIVAFVSIFTKEFDTAKKIFLSIRKNYDIELNTNYFYATLLFYEGADSSRYVHLFEEMIQLAEKRGQETKTVLEECEKDYLCKNNAVYGKLVKLFRRYERAKGIAMNLYVFGVAVDIAEGRKTAEAWWPRALSLASSLEKKIYNERDTLGPKFDLSVKDTISFIKIVGESREITPNKKIILQEVEKLMEIEQNLLAELGGAGREAKSINDTLKSVRGHIQMGVSILEE